MVAQRVMKKSGVDFESLRQSIKDSRDELKEHRRIRTKILRQYAGHHYPGGTVADEFNREVPLPMLEKMIDTLVYQVAAQLPNVNVRAQKPSLNRDADSMEDSLNQLGKEIFIGDALTAIAFNAMVGPVGISKTGLTAGRKVEWQGFTHDIGQPFVHSVDFDDFVFDILAKRWDQIEYVGDRIRMPLDKALASGLYDRKALKAAAFDHVELRNEDGQLRAESIGLSGRTLRSEISLQVELWELWLPGPNLMVTMVLDRSGDVAGKPVRVDPWDGPEMGPYRLLKFRTMSNQILAPSPALSLLPLHMHVNEITWKAMEQASAQKINLAVPSGSQDEANKIARTNNLEAFSIAPGHEVPQEVRWGGTDGSLQNTVIQELAMFDDFAGSLSLLTGANPQADTLGQTKILQSNASQRIQDWQRRMYAFTEGVYHDLAYWHVTDPFINRQVTKRIPGISEEFIEQWRPFDAESDWLDFNFEIVPGSLQPKSPEEISQQLIGVVTQVFLPLMPLLQQSGKTIDVGAVVDLMARNNNLPELHSLIVDLQPGAQPLAVGNQPPKAGGGQQQQQAPSGGGGPAGLANQLGAAQAGADIATPAAAPQQPGA